MIEMPGISIVIGFLLFAVVVAIILVAVFFVIRKMIRSEVNRMQKTPEQSSADSLDN